MIMQISLIYDEYYLNNKIFDLSNKMINIDNLAYQYYVFKEAFLNRGYKLDTYDLVSNWKHEIKFYFNLQHSDLLTQDVNNSFLFIFEPEIIQPQLYDKNYHQKFNKIFTFCDELVDNKKYFKINYSYLIPTKLNKNINIKSKLCTLVAGNKMVSHPLELYSKRVEAIRWFETHHLEEFDLYGRGWREYVSSNRLFNMISRRVPLVKQILKLIYAKPFLSYRGEIDDKIPVLEKYRFAICYENARDIPGYITEKIFHCFFAGCVPIYWGANNITDYVPANCFIDKRKFKSYEELYSYINNISDAEYLNYLINIEKYLNSEQIQQFSAENFANTVIKEVLNEG